MFRSDPSRKTIKDVHNGVDATTKCLRKRKKRQEIGLPRDKIMGAVFKSLLFLGFLCADTHHHIDLSIGKKKRKKRPNPTRTPHRRNRLGRAGLVKARQG